MAQESVDQEPVRFCDLSEEEKLERLTLAAIGKFHIVIIEDITLDKLYTFCALSLKIPICKFCNGFCARRYKDPYSARLKCVFCLRFQQIPVEIFYKVMDREEDYRAYKGEYYDDSFYPINHKDAEENYIAAREEYHNCLLQIKSGNPAYSVANIEQTIIPAIKKLWYAEYALMDANCEGPPND